MNMLQLTYFASNHLHMAAPTFPNAAFEIDKLKKRASVLETCFPYAVPNMQP